MNVAPEIWFGIGAALIALGLAAGWMMNKTRDRANDPRTEAATREQYRQAEEDRKRGVD